MTAKELREKRAAMQVRIKELAERSNDEKVEWSAEDESNWDAVNADFDAAGAELSRVERADAVEKEMEQVESRVEREDFTGAQGRTLLVSDNTRAMAFRGWVANSAGKAVSDDCREAAQACGVNLNARQFDINLMSDYRAARKLYRDDSYMSTSDGTGGEFIPEGFIPTVEVALVKFGGVRQVATVLRTDSGNTLPWPTSNDTSNEGALLDESTADSDQNIATSSVDFGAFKFTSKIVKVPYELMQDSAVNLEQFVARVVGERIGRAQNGYFTTGAGGATEPNGIVTASHLGVTTAASGTIASTDVIDLVHSCDVAYRDNAMFMCHDEIVKTLRKLTDENGQFLWANGLNGGKSETLYGYPVVINNSMATISASAKVCLFGALDKYVIRDAGAIRVKRLEERYSEYDQIAFVALMRSDGDLLDAGTYPVKHLIMHA